MSGSLPKSAGRKQDKMASSTGANAGHMSPINRSRCINSDCRLLCNLAKAHCAEFLAIVAKARMHLVNPSNFFCDPFRARCFVTDMASEVACARNNLEAQVLEKSRSNFHTLWLHH